MSALAANGINSNADAGAPPFFSSSDLQNVEQDLRFEFLQMVTHYKGVAARRVVEVDGLRKAARASALSRL